MKTPYYSGAFMVAQHADAFDKEQLRERMLESRLANRDDVRDIYIVTVPFANVLSSPVGADLVKQASKHSRTDLSWAMHWAVQVGDQFYELQRGYVDPTRTGLRMSKWDQQKHDQILQRYRQGSTAMSDDEIKAVGDKHFSRLNRMHVNKYDLWTNNCQVAVDRMLREIGGLDYYRSKLESLHEWIRQFFCNSMLSITRMYYRRRGCDEEVLVKHEKVLRNALHVMTSRSIHYPKRQWIREDIEAAESLVEKIGAVGDHWFLAVIESSLSMRKGTDMTYVRRGSDGKAELNFNAVKEATKGIFKDGGKTTRAAWAKTIPWLAAGFLVGTLNWAVAVITVAVQHVHQCTQSNKGLKGGLEMSLLGIGISPKLQNGSFASPKMSKPRVRRTLTQQGSASKSKALSGERELVARYERRFATSGTPYYYDNMEKSQSWDAPDQQEMCLKIMDPPLSRKWEVRQTDSYVSYVNRITGDVVDERPGPTEIWAVKKKTKPDWVQSTFMPLPHGWEMRRTEEGQRHYLNHHNDPPTSTSIHPMRKEIEDERRKILPEWNVEWDDDRGKKYRNMQTGEVRWKAIDGIRHIPSSIAAKKVPRPPMQDFVEPLPAGWTVTVGDDGESTYRNETQRAIRTTHPLTDMRKRLLPDWEMRYTPSKRRYWVHYGQSDRGSVWWTRNKILKNTTLKNDACGWKLAKNGGLWEWFEGGDVPHSEIPLLDLDDPEEIEFREYPLILPMVATGMDETFLEPLPPHWLMRESDDESVYYWNFKDEVRSDQHPCEKERANLSALWEMRYTRYGRQYFIHHNDGSTWWTNPQEDKHEQKLRAMPGQSQDGWKLAADSKTWERFEERPGVGLAEQETNEDDVPEDEAREKWQSAAFTKNWLKNVGNDGLVATAMVRIRDPIKALRKGEKSNDPGRGSVDSLEESLDEKKTRETISDIVEELVEVPSTSDTASSGRRLSSKFEESEQTPISELTSPEGLWMPEYADETTGSPTEEIRLSEKLDEELQLQSGKKKSWASRFKKSAKTSGNAEETSVMGTPPEIKDDVDTAPTDSQEDAEEAPVQPKLSTRKSWAKKAFQRTSKSVKSPEISQEQDQAIAEEPAPEPPFKAEARGDTTAEMTETQRSNDTDSEKRPPLPPRPAPASSTPSFTEEQQNRVKALWKSTNSKAEEVPNEGGEQDSEPAE